jgi:hypothetical protein
MPRWQDSQRIYQVSGRKVNLFDLVVEVVELGDHPADLLG